RWRSACPPRTRSRLAERSRRSAARAGGPRCARPARKVWPRYPPSYHARKEGSAMTDVVDAPVAVKPINHWISGTRHAGQSGRSGPVFNPATGEQSGAVDFASAEEVDQAVQAAKAAFPAWRSLSLAKRAE